MASDLAELGQSADDDYLASSAWQSDQIYFNVGYKISLPVLGAPLGDAHFDQDF